MCRSTSRAIFWSARRRAFGPSTRPSRSRPWRRISREPSRCRRVRALPRAGFFPGSTIGNFEPGEAKAFLRHAAAILGPGAALVVGVDLVKDADVLNRAY